MRLKERTEVALGDAEGKVSYVQFLTQLSFLCRVAPPLERGAAVARLWVGLSDLNQLLPMTANSESTIGSGELSSRAHYRGIRSSSPGTAKKAAGLPGFVAQYPWIRGYQTFPSETRVPAGVRMFFLQTAGWIVFSCILMSFIEHQVHRKLMHRKNFLSARRASFKRMFEAHALVHHRHYAEIFSDEPVARGEDEEIRLTVRKAPIKAAPFAAPIALVSWEGAVTFVAVVVFHHWAWNKIHLEMHKPEQRVFSNWPVYRFLARYHCLHHRHVNRNFNVVFPLADYILGTSVRVNEGDLSYLERSGL